MARVTATGWMRTRMYRGPSVTLSLLVLLTLFALPWHGATAAIDPQPSSESRPRSAASLDFNAVYVESKTVTAGETGVTIPILLENSVPLQALEVPLVIREVTPGSYITALTLSYGDRLPEGGPISDLISWKKQYPTPDGGCKPGGFATDGTANFISPDGVFFARVRLVGPPLEPGIDVTGSLILTMDVTSTPGLFEIDTTCVDPSEHLLFVEDITNIRIAPAFTKGVVTILPPLILDSVSVTSKTVNAGETGVTIPLRIRNSVPLMFLEVPLVIREVTPGSYITALSLSYGERLPEGGPMSDLISWKKQYPTPDGGCKTGGFGTEGTADFISPDGVFFVRYRMLTPPLDPGNDVTGSLILTVDVTSSPGSFEIDTTCVDPSEHLLFIEDGTANMIAPAFAKGVVTILPPVTLDSVTVTSKTVNAGETGVTIPVRLRNTVPLKALEVPLVIREVTSGSYITALALSYGERLPEGGPISDFISWKKQYPTPDGLCKTGGFATAGTADFISPEGVLFVRMRMLTPPLEPGNDVTGSLILTMDVTSTPGSFEIDTTCIDPGDHLGFVNDGTNLLFTPAFRKGIVTIVQTCQCQHQADFDLDGFLTSIDLGSLIDILFAGLTDTQDPPCPATRSDFDCDGFPTSLDLGSMIDHLFAGGTGPCDPCRCVPNYPEDCPPWP